MIKLPYYQEVSSDIQDYDKKFPFWIWVYSQESSFLHHHDFSELCFIVEGSGSESVNGFSHTITSGTATFIPPHQMHKFQSDPGNLIRKYCLIFDIGLLSRTSLNAGMINRLAAIRGEFAFACHAVGGSKKSHDGHAERNFAGVQP